MPAFIGRARTWLVAAIVALGVLAALATHERVTRAVAAESEVFGSDIEVLLVRSPSKIHGQPDEISARFGGVDVRAAAKMLPVGNGPDASPYPDIESVVILRLSGTWKGSKLGYCQGLALIEETDASTNKTDLSEYPACWHVDESGSVIVDAGIFRSRFQPGEFGPIVRTSAS